MPERSMKLRFYYKKKVIYKCSDAVNVNQIKNTEMDKTHW